MKSTQVFIATILTCCAIMILLASPLRSQEPQPTDKVKVLAIPACAFVPAERNYNYNFIHGEIRYYSSSPGTFVTPLIVPNGTRLTKIAFRFKDDDADKDLSLRIVRRTSHYNYNIEDFIYVLTPLGADMNFQTRYINLHTPIKIDNIKYCYYLEVKFPGNINNPEKMVFHSVRLYYKGKW